MEPSLFIESCLRDCARFIAKPTALKSDEVYNCGSWDPEMAERRQFCTAVLVRKDVLPRTPATTPTMGSLVFCVDVHMFSIFLVWEPMLCCWLLCRCCVPQHSIYCMVSSWMETCTAVQAQSETVWNCKGLLCKVMLRHIIWCFAWWFWAMFDVQSKHRELPCCKVSVGESLWECGGERVRFVSLCCVRVRECAKPMVCSTKTSPKCTRMPSEDVGSGFCPVGGFRSEM